MPLYEYYCQNCNGVFENLRPMKDASLPAACPECDGEGQRIMSGFSAFVVRDGLPRRIPDRGTFWSLKGEVKRPQTRGMPWDHPETKEPDDTPKPTKGDVEEKKERQVAKKAEDTRRKRDIQPITPKPPKTLLTATGQGPVKDI